MIAASSPRKSSVLEERRRVFFFALRWTTGTFILSSVTFIPVQQAYEMRVGVAGSAVLASRFIMNELGPTHPAAIAGNVLHS